MSDTEKKIYFGEEQAFILPMDYLTSVSPYFENAFKGAFREAVEKKIKLPNVKIKTFSIYVEWLYSRHIVDKDGEAFVTENATYTPRHSTLLNLYLFADEYDHPQLRRDVLQVFVKHSNQYENCVPIETVIKAYNRLPSTSPLLRFLVDHYAHEWNASSNKIEPPFPAQFLFSLSVKSLTQAMNHELPRRVESPYLNDCDYHEHDVEKEAGK
ncbi:putative btb poz domain containing protein [Venturia nashicola]|nr:putative btb poz domain containing protein [Venturia nashicola]